MKSASFLFVLGCALGLGMAGSVEATPLAAWDNVIDRPGRFAVLNDFNDAAVLDKETGLVWEQSPEATRRQLNPAHQFCNNLVVGGRKGWRLPTVQELASLLDPNNPGGDPDLPPGHPFSNVQSDIYWSANTSGADPARFQWAVTFRDGFVLFINKIQGNHFVWCVRGGHGGPDVQ